MVCRESCSLQARILADAASQSVCADDSNLPLLEASTLFTSCPPASLFALSSLCLANQPPPARLPLLRKNSPTSCAPQAQVFSQHAPHKTRQLARHRRHSHIPLHAPLNQPGRLATQTFIRPIRVGDHLRRVPALSRLQVLGLVPDSSPVPGLCSAPPPPAAAEGGTSPPW